MQKKKFKNVKELFIAPSTVNYAFELPRQQQDKISKPEVMQFKTSQRLLNVNQNQIQDNRKNVGPGERQHLLDERKRDMAKLRPRSSSQQPRLRRLAENVENKLKMTSNSSTQTENSLLSSEPLLTLNREFYDQSLNGRFVSAIDFSTFHPELIATAYDRRNDEKLSHAGIVHVWNSKFKVDRPEYTFHSPSRITSLQFARFHSNIIVGGLYSGQICIWDNRDRQKMPVRKSSSPLALNSGPIYCMANIGNLIDNEFVTFSKYGKRCTWALDNLSNPISGENLTYKTQKKLSVTSLCFLNNNITSFVTGSDEGAMYSGMRNGKSTLLVNKYELHRDRISSVDTHHATGSTTDFSSLCLTASWDSTVKLTNLDDENGRPLLTMNHHRRVLDVKWSPTHPAAFASMTSGGSLNLWNLNQDTDSPMASTQIDQRCSDACILWNKNGEQLAVGDAKGRLLIYDLKRSYYRVWNEEFTDFNNKLKEVERWAFIKDS